MSEKHYGKYIRNDADEQLGRVIGAKPITETKGETVEELTGTDASEAAENIGEKIGGPTWIRTRWKEKIVGCGKVRYSLGKFQEFHRLADFSPVPI